jgi:hypothetical protein
LDGITSATIMGGAKLRFCQKPLAMKAKKVMAIVARLQPCVASAPLKVGGRGFFLLRFFLFYLFARI